jgi:hypothetical protein
VTLEALVQQLPPGCSADAAAAGSSSTAAGASSISSACWQAAVKQMQRDAPVLGTKQQVRSLFHLLSADAVSLRAPHMIRARMHLACMHQSELIRAIGVLCG